MKKLLILSLMNFGLSSCDFLVPDRWIGDNEPERFSFTFKNTSSSLYEDIVIYAIDSNEFYADSSGKQGISPNSSFFVTIDIPKLTYISKGVFEIKAKLNGKRLIQRFGKINNPVKNESFIIEFRDSTIVIK